MLISAETNVSDTRTHINLAFIYIMYVRSPPSQLAGYIYIYSSFVDVKISRYRG